ncbi:MAG: AbrB/MazE/SpoVT family DNA-binding domain-containing protein [Candidatus Sulfotelmatobacter sp.]|jgi:AbrB family looped-hinge helix DNA binding protein
MSEKRVEIYPFRIGPKGRVTIPVALRERLELHAGTQVEWRSEGGRLVITPVARLPRKRR